ncbi:hypothetical protein BDU_1042 (plasmid) [Borrelia duttonii Ly]|uniref:Uncharacterized protein n=2 Tax=Borrelia duttonii TaxID=40834 RepID=B5RNA4_BORDL|nr:hypothetical protein BDU_1042 [Borrelia duttonii Ly]
MMQQICVVIFSFVLVLSCRQGSSENVSSSIVRKSKIKPNQVVTGVAEYKENGFDVGKVLFIEDNVDRKKILLTPDQAYEALVVNLEKLKALYKKPKGFYVSFFDDFEEAFGVEEMQALKDSLYAVLNWDVNIINKLKKIVLFSVENKSDYLYEKNAEPLIDTLRKIFWRTIYAVIVKYNGSEIFSVANLAKIKSIGNVENLNEISVMLSDMYNKFNDIMKLIEYVINDVAKLNAKNLIIKGLGPIINLDCIYEQKCVTGGADVLGIGFKMCKLKNDLINLRTRITEKVFKIIYPEKETTSEF